MVKLFFITLLCINSFSVIGNVNNDSNLIIDELPKDFKQLGFKKVGNATFSVLFWDIYNSTLYTKSGAYLHENSVESLIFEIEYLKDITKEDLLDRTIEQWKYLKIPESEYGKFVLLLKPIWSDVAAGDKLAMLVEKNESVFYFNEVKIGQIKEKEFSKLFLDIWLSPQTSQKELRNYLLGEIR